MYYRTLETYHWGIYGSMFELYLGNQHDTQGLKPGTRKVLMKHATVQLILVE